MSTKEQTHARWYFVQTYSGQEERVRKNLEQRIETMDMRDKIFQVVIPTEEIVEIKEGKRIPKQERLYPGYLLVQMAMDDESWYVVRNTPGVTGFVSAEDEREMRPKPVPLEQWEVDDILHHMESDTPKARVGFTAGQNVRVTDGPFADFIGMVENIDHERGKVRVLVSFFGRETPVELDFLQVEKL